MATARAFGSITIVDLTDIGEFSIYPMSNLPLSVLYSPDEDTYNPSWTTNNLILTPVVYYAGNPLTLGSSGLSITWQKMEGISLVEMNANEENTNGVLKVKSNQFNENSSIITYIVTATYEEPMTKQVLTAQGQISFSLVKMASEAKNIIVNGNNIFKYNSSGVCDISSTTLSATITDNLEMKDWEYSNDDGFNWNSLSNATSALVVNEKDSIFANDRVLIRAIAKNKRDENDLYYDYITVFKLRDGTAAGNSLVLSNESQQIPCESDGSPTTTAFNLSNTSISIYESGGEVTSQYTITATPNGVLGAWTNSTTQKPTGTANVNQAKGSFKYFWVTGWNSSNASDVAEVTFTATKGTEILTKKMSLIKIKTGANGVSPTIYSLDLSDLVVNKSFIYSDTPDANGNYSITKTEYEPKTITATVTQTTGNTTIPYTGYVRVYPDGDTSKALSGTANSDGKYVLTGIGSNEKTTPVSYFTFELKTGSGASDTVLDTQNVIVTSDGSKGSQGGKGDDGASAINLVLGNYSDTIPVTIGYKPTSAQTITIPFAVYEGTTMIPATISATNAKITFGGTNITPTVVNSTASAYGTLTYNLTTSNTIGSSSVKNGSKSLTFSYTTASGHTGTTTATYSWALSVAPKDGTNPIMLQVFTPKGYVFTNGDGNLDITAQLMNGASPQTENVTYQWAKYENGDYVNISGATNATLNVDGTSVDGYASYMCTAMFGGNPYVGYASLIDKTDPVQVSILSTVGTQIINGQGVGAFYAIVTRNGQEIDALKATDFVLTKPSPLVNGKKYYWIDSGDKAVKLMKATSTSAWSEVTNATENKYVGDYTWTYRDVDNKAVTTGIPATSGKVVYIDASLINKKITIDVEVNI